jgi:DNA-binding HxlR family transcriptional regulator
MAAGSRPKKRRSTCPINASVEVVGDGWSLLIVRDLLFAGARTYKDFQSSGEGIATNILANRLARLEERGILTSRRDPEDGRKLIYQLTAKGVDLAPAILELSRWGVTYEEGLAPPGVLEAWDADRAAFLAGLRKRLLNEPAAGPQVQDRRAR